MWPIVMWGTDALTTAVVFMLAPIRQLFYYFYFSRRRSVQSRKFHSSLSLDLYVNPNSDRPLHSVHDSHTRPTRHLSPLTLACTPSTQHGNRQPNGTGLPPTGSMDNRRLTSAKRASALWRRALSQTAGAATTLARPVSTNRRPRTARRGAGACPSAMCGARARAKTTQALVVDRGCRVSTGG